MDYQQFIVLCNQAFDLDLGIYKEKAGYMMMIDKKSNKDAEIGGPDCGYSCPHRVYSVTLPSGWAYAYSHATRKWYLINDRVVGHRDKNTENPYPDYPALPPEIHLF